jgi:phosphoglycerol transferase
MDMDVPPRTDSSTRRELALYAIALGLCVGVFAILFQPWKADPRIPIDYTGDALVHTGWIKNIVETGWFESNDRFGYPGRQDLRDFPSTDSLHHLTCKFLALFTSDACLLFNVFYSLTFPLTTIAALFVLRRLGLSGSIAIATSLLYTYQPYHLLRVGHLLLSAYYLAPIACLIALRIYQDRPFLDGEDGRGRGRRGHTIAAVLLCAAFGGSGAYYAFFSCFLILVGGLAGAWTHRRWSPLLRASGMCAIAFLAFLASAASALEHRLNEPNADVAERHPADAETYGLKIVHMLMPVRGHRVGVLRDLEGSYSLGPTPLNNENTTASLGIIGAIGLVYLLSRVVFNRVAGRGNALDGLAVLVLAAVLLGTIGGFGSAFSFVVSPWIRGYNRISIFIAFMALAASAMLLEKLRQRMTTASHWQSARWLSGVALLGAIGLFDQTHRRLLPEPGVYRAGYEADRDFVAELEARLPEGSAILQMPNCPYPNYIFRFDSHDFNGHEHLRSQIHSKTLRWSYGSMPGHRGYLWNRRLEEKSLEQQCVALIDAGFQGICLNRSGYADCGESIQKELESLLGPPSLISTDGRLCYFDLNAIASQLMLASNDTEREHRRDRALHPVLVYWTSGFFEEQIHPKTLEHYRWGRHSAQFILENGSREAQSVRLRWSVAVPETRKDCALTIQSELFAETLSVGRSARQFERIVVVPPGRHRVHFDCDGPVQPIWQAPGKRGIVFRISHFCCEEVMNADEAMRQCDATARLRQR